MLLFLEGNRWRHELALIPHFKMTSHLKDLQPISYNTPNQSQRLCVIKKKEHYNPVSHTNFNILPYSPSASTIPTLEESTLIVFTPVF